MSDPGHGKSLRPTPDAWRYRDRDRFGDNEWRYLDLPPLHAYTEVTPLYTQPTVIITDAMVDTVGAALYRYWNDVSASCRDKYREKVRAALHDALTSKEAPHD